MIYKKANPYRCHFNISIIYRSNMLRKLGPGQWIPSVKIPVKKPIPGRVIGLLVKKFS